MERVNMKAGDAGSSVIELHGIQEGRAFDPRQLHQ